MTLNSGPGLNPDIFPAVKDFIIIVIVAPVKCLTLKRMYSFVRKKQKTVLTGVSSEAFVSSSRRLKHLGMF